MTCKIIEADWTYLDGQFEPGLRVQVEADGRISRVGGGDEPTERLEGCALLPGFVNAHSHAFQRGLRGLAETFPEKSGNFWVWRDEMYRLVGELGAERFHAVCVQCFREMLRCGITTVGEFHYFHHDETCGGFAFDELVLSAAKEAGIRIVLLNACYMTGDIGQPLQGGQRRFGADSVDAFLENVARVDAMVDGELQRQGLVAHSIRAVPIDDIVRLHEHATEQKMVLHMHVEEQQREIDMCLLHHKMRPMELLLDRVPIGREFTAVHCTHTDPADMTRFIDRGANICICPLTEANLGDGISAAAKMWADGGQICLGSDSNNRIDMLEEMRLLEYGQRLRHEGRGVFKGRGGSVADGLVRMATEGGARSLNVEAGSISPGHYADFVAIDLNAPQSAGWNKETLLTSLVFGCDASVIKGVCVGRNWVV